MDYIYAELDPSLLPISQYKLYYGSTANIPTTASFSSLNELPVPTSMTAAGITLPFVTSAAGQFEVFAYPKAYNPVKTIISTEVGINALGAWTKIETIYDNLEYYIYYTTLKQYDDRVELEFTFQNS